MLSVLIVGTGFGGLSAAINLLKKNISDFVLLERRSFAGGTWLQNSYPGAAVDVQSPLYSLTGHPYPWSHLFAKQNELADYTQGIIKQYGLSNKIRLNSNVANAKWCEGHWKVYLDCGECIEAKILINATGPLSTPSVPKFKGLDSYKGEWFHSNNWQSDIDLNNKTVAVVGSGASAVQIIPAIVDKVKSLHVFQRSPHWILPRPDWHIPKWLRKPLAFKPVYAAIRWFIYWSLELRVIAFKYSKSLLNLVGQKPALRLLKKQVTNNALRTQLTPDFTIGCKRILVSNTFYPAIQQANTSLHTSADSISHFDETGIVCAQSGKLELDIVIFATGYRAADSIVSYEVTGRNTIQLSQQWADFPRAYLGTSLPNFPNFFVVTGPNTGIGHTSAIFVIESQMTYIMQVIQKLCFEGVREIEPTEYAEDQYTNMVHKEMAKTVWSYGGCSSWYQNAQGKVIAMFPGFSFMFRRLCKKFKSKHHKIVE